MSTTLAPINFSPIQPTPIANPFIPQSGNLHPLLDTLTNKSTSSSTKSKKIDTYQEYNVDTAEALEALDLNNSNTPQRLRDCGHIGATVRCDKGHEVQVFRNHCREYRLCPMCAKRRTKELNRELWPLVQHIEQKPVWGYKWRLGTLTTKPCGSHKEAVALALSAFSKLWRNMLDKTNCAAIRSLEFGPENGNVHLHFLYYGPYIDQAEVSEEWERLTGAKVMDNRLAGNVGGMSLKGAVKEVIK